MDELQVCTLSYRITLSPGVLSKALDANTATSQVHAFVLTNNGLMAGVSLDRAKVTRLRSLNQADGRELNA